MNPDLSTLLAAVAAGTLSPAAALAQLQETVGDFAHVDRFRAQRTGFPEAIFCPGKTPAQIVAIAQSLRDTPLLLTRLTSEVHRAIAPHLRELQYFPLARLGRWGTPAPPQAGTVAILSAGTADLPVAEEAALTLETCGFTVQRIPDVGVAGLHRLFQRWPEIQPAQCLIVVAGMDGALPSVVAGLSDRPVIAVPTSTGYGAHLGGLAPLLTMLNTCAPGLGVVNIDNGFGAALLAGKILRVPHP